MTGCVMQLARLDRYESRLTSMAYMGNFDDLLTTTQPVNILCSFEVCLKMEFSFVNHTAN